MEGDAEGLDHVGIAVAKLEDAVARWSSLLRAPGAPPEEVPAYGVRVAFLSAGGTRVELLEPLSPDSPIRRFLNGHDEALHHVAFRVPSVDRALDLLVARGERVVDRAGRPGAHGMRVGFAHPAAFGGVLVEFVERP